MKAKYGLWVTDAERAAIADVLSSCIDVPVVSDTDAVGEGPARQQAAPTRQAEAVPAPTTAESGGSTYYENCTAVRAAGADPIRRGEPGYSSKLDRDGDGIACE